MYALRIFYIFIHIKYVLHILKHKSSKTTFHLM